MKLFRHPELKFHTFLLVDSLPAATHFSSSVISGATKLKCDAEDFTLQVCCYILCPIRGEEDYNHASPEPRM